MESPETQKTKMVDEYGGVGGLLEWRVEGTILQFQFVVERERIREDKERKEVPTVRTVFGVGPF